MKERAARKPRAERRRKLLDGAQSVFAEASYAEAGTADVARAAGVVPSAIYRLFPSKKELYLATLADARKRLLALWRRASEEPGDPLEAVRSLGLAYFEHVEGRAPFARLWFRALAEANDPEVRQAVAANFLAQVERIEALIERGAREGSVRPEVDARIAAWHFMAIGLSFDLIHRLELDDELGRERVEAWGELYIDSLRRRARRGANQLLEDTS